MLNVIQFKSFDARLRVLSILLVVWPAACSDDPYQPSTDTTEPDVSFDSADDVHVDTDVSSPDSGEVSSDTATTDTIDTSESDPALDPTVDRTIDRNEEPPPEVCIPNPCLEPNTVCEEFLERNTYRCVCAFGFEDNGFGRCVSETPVDYPGPCATEPAACQSENRICLNSGSAAVCGGCQAGFVEAGESCTAATSDCLLVTIIADPITLEGTTTELARFVDDLEREGYCAAVLPYWGTDPTEIRALLIASYEAHPNMVGAILVGDIPYPYQTYWKIFANPEFEDEEQTSISFQYYRDLDGEFSVSDAPPTEHLLLLDGHSGSVDSEIWVSVLPFYLSIDETIEAIRAYFDRNHDYRCGLSSFGSGLLVLNEHHSADTIEGYEAQIETLRSGQYAWTPLSLRLSSEHFVPYEGTTVDGIGVTYGYEQRLTSSDFNLALFQAHGSVHQVGSLHTSWLETHTIGSPFIMSFGCNTGNLNHTTNFVSSAFYQTDSEIVLAFGQTELSGGLGSNSDGFYGSNLASSLDSGATFGQAFVSHINGQFVDPYDNNWEWQMSTAAFWGDLTLRLQEHMATSCE